MMEKLTKFQAILCHQALTRDKELYQKKVNKMRVDVRLKHKDLIAETLEAYDIAINKMHTPINKKENESITKLRKVLNDYGYEYEEDTEKIKLTMTNHFVSIDKMNLSVMDDFNGSLYKDIDDVIDSILNK